MGSLASKEIRFFKTRYVLIFTIIFLIASLIFIISGLAKGLSHDNASFIEEMEATHYLMTMDSNGRLDRSTILESDGKGFLQNPALEPFSLRLVSIVSEKNNTPFDITIIGVDKNSKIFPEIGEGVLLSDSNQIIVDSSLKQDGFQLGDTLIEPRSEAEFTIVGFTKKQKYSHTPGVFMSLEDYSEIGRQESLIYNAVAVNNIDSKTMEEVLNHSSNLHWVTKEEVIQNIPGNAAEQMSLSMMIIFLLIISTCILAAFFYILTIQKVQQFGVLKAIGASNGFLVKSTLSQVILLSLSGILAALLFISGFQMILPKQIPFLLELETIAVYTILLFIVALFGAGVSVINIVKVDPIITLGGKE